MATSLNGQLELAEVYARSLFDLAKQAGSTDAVRDELRQLAELLAQQPDLAEFMSSAIITQEQRAASLDRMFRGKLSDLVLSTLQVMNQHGRSELVAALAQRFAAIQLRAAGQVRTRVVSATELGSEQKQSIEQTAAKVSGLAPIVEYQVDPAILGGLIVQVGDLRYDNSVRSQLGEARRKLLDRTHMIAAGQTGM